TPSATSQNRSDVCVDARLASALSKGGKKVQPGASVSKAEIGKAFESKGLELYTAIVPPGSECRYRSVGEATALLGGDAPPADLTELLKYGPAPMITIRVTDKVSGNKTQTLIGGVEKYHLKLSDFAKALAKHNASSSTVRDDPVLGPNTVMVQGNVAQSVMHFLVEAAGVPRDRVEIV
ncbi:Eukaryotic translation initiation factor 2D, partial [Perkinsus olseni]